VDARQQRAPDQDAADDPEHRQDRHGAGQPYQKRSLQRLEARHIAADQQVVAARQRVRTSADIGGGRPARSVTV
jgi:hypothetical protein